MKALYELPAPAKLNLFLHVTGQRADGYHLLQSAFVLIDWCDTLHFELRSDGVISREDVDVDVFQPLPEIDLTVRAAQALQQATGARQGVHIVLRKSIPAQAGMGGGSSDAATCLIALNRLWNLSLSRAQLEAIGLRLGADVPFFLRGDNACWIEGVGEQMTPLVLPQAQFVVIKPQAGLSTADVFQDPALKRDHVAATIASFAADPYGFGQNDLQPVAQKCCPDITAALDWLQTRGLQGRMTGSGSAVFARTLQPVDVSDVPSGWAAKVCNTLKVHPLAQWTDKTE